MIRNLLMAATVSLTAAGSVRAAEAPPASPAPPAEVKQLLAQMAGTWTAKEVTATVDGKTMKMASKVTCDKSAAGYALTCRVHADMGAMKFEEIAIIGWDAKTNAIHLFSVNNDGNAHDHKGTFANNVFALEYGATTDGKPFHEALSFTFKGPKELVWKDVYKLAGQEVFSGEGTYKK